jgi:hypothetical protein
LRYISKSEREAASRMTWTELLAHVIDAKRCSEGEARRQIGNAVEDGGLHVRWADQRKDFGPPSHSSAPGDEPPRDASYWQECKTDPNDPDLALEPPPYDSELVDKRTTARLDKKRRFRKPTFQKAQASKLWPLVPPSTPLDPTQGGSDRVVSLDSRTRGPKPETSNRIKGEMRNDLRTQALTKQGLRELKEEALAVQYGASRDTCRKARQEVLSESEFVDNSPDRNSDK